MAETIQNANTATRAGEIAKFQVIEAKKDAKRWADLSLACVELSYYEDILSNSISASATIVESGLSNSDVGNKKGNKKGYIGFLDGLPVRGGEQVNLIFRDNQNEPTTLTFRGGRGGKGKELYVNRVRQINPGTQREVYTLDLCTRECISNEQSRVVKRYDGNIARSVVKILKDALSGTSGIKTPKRIEADSTFSDYNFIGNDKKPFYICTWLASKAVPVVTKNGKNIIGGSAGFLFFETYDGYKFKSIENLFDHKTRRKGNIKKFIYTNTPDLPESGEYDAKILSVDVERDIDLVQNLTMGTYANNTILFDPVNFDYKHQAVTVDKNQKDKVENAGTQDVAQDVAPEFTHFPSRVMSRVLDVGTLPAGITADKQLESWFENKQKPTWEAGQAMAQAAMRYNQMFTIKLNVTIAGDFSLRAGDLVQCDFPELTVSDNKGVNYQTGGNYLVASLCHRLTPDDCYTRLTLIRASFGRRTIAATVNSNDTSAVVPLALNNTAIPGDYDYRPPSGVSYQGGIPLQGV